MSTTELSSDRVAAAESVPRLASAQPGGGFCHRAELVWARFRRWRLKRFRPGYVRRMATLRRGDPSGAPHEILDPRDLKYCRVCCDCYWDAADDPFRWRGRFPLTAWGWIELNLCGWPLLAATLMAAWWFWPLAIAPGLVLLWMVWFFRNPPRKVPDGPGLVVAPADGKVVEVERLTHHDFIGGPAVQVGIFLSIFNVHLNRAPMAGRVVGVRYTPGPFFNALQARSATDNENTWIGFEQEGTAGRRFVVRQIAGAIARRIVCDLKPGQRLGRGEEFGMIKFGSRTELILPDSDALTIAVKPGQAIRAGSTVIGQYMETPGEARVHES